mmetsp:Transcript_34319/g.83267  ORF Transcript_34319/g.83267 Transcript_34319/m.83267 type:complete len:416 (+) Transcript_34319:1333-2580(+)
MKATLPPTDSDSDRMGENPTPTTGTTTTTTSGTNSMMGANHSEEFPYQYRPFMFVHIGKAGGSSLMDVFRSSHIRCEKTIKLSGFPGKEEMLRNYTGSMTTPRKRLEDMTEEERTMALKDQMCRVAFPPKMRIHMNGNDIFTTVKKYSSFVATVRNPIDRIISWYYYERYRVSAVNYFKHSIPGKKYAYPFHKHCYRHPTAVGTMIREVLLSKPANDSKRKDCIQLATRCLSGDIPCYAHNYFNYETYLEDILLWKGAASAVAISKGGPNATNATVSIVPVRPDTLRDIQISVLRTKHVMEDLNKTILLWSGLPIMNETAELYVVKNAQSDRTGTQYNKTLSVEEAGSLCRFLCIELVVYKKFVGLAENLSKEDIQEEYDDLDRSCRFSVDEVCGTEYTYRNVKKLKGPAVYYAR